MSFGALFILALSGIFTAADLSRAVEAGKTNIPFVVEGVLQHDYWPGYNYFSLAGTNGAVILNRKTDIPTDSLRAGNFVRASGVTVQGERRFACADCTNVEVLCRGQAPAPRTITLAEFNGGTADARFVRLKGTVRDIFRDERSKGFVYLALADATDAAYAAFRDDRTGPADHSAFVGCEVAIIGLCNPDEGGARHHFGRMLIANGPSSVAILRRPPWWTPLRLLVVIVALLLVLVGVTVWNASLRTKVERRSRDLLNEHRAHVESELKVEERTRLAVELHDTIAQNLTGAALELNTVEQLVQEDSRSALRHLSLALKTLSSCRKELRNCLWDLHSQALEESDMNDAIRRTLEPHVENIALTVRFNVPRALFTDNTAHALMRMIRELVLNAIRHGQARTVKIAGSREGNRLLFSVRDDGCGFDPQKAPDITSGHFGLQGIRERIKKLKGTVEIVSSPQGGTKVTVGLDLPAADGEKA